MSRSYAKLCIPAILALCAAVSASPARRDLLFSSVPAVPQPSEPDDGVWWDAFKASASDEQLYEAIFRLPKGGDTHAHLSGSIYAEEIIDLVERAEVNDGVVFMVRTSDGPECTDEAVSGLYGIVYESVMATFSAPCQSQYTGIKDLTPAQLANLKDLISLHYKESRSNFFANNINLTAGDPLGAAALPSGNYIQPWGAYGQIFDSAWLWLECLAIYLKRSAAHNLQYVEVDFDPRFRVTGPERTPVSVAEFRELLDSRLAQTDLADLDVVARFQIVTLRFLPSSGDDLESAMQFVASDCNDPWVGVDIVGYETQDFPSDGSTYRFRSVADKVLRKNSCVGIGFHSGEKTKAETETELKYGAGSIRSIEVTSGGSGYVSAPAVTISNNWAVDGAYATATATATVSDGAVSSIIVTSFGSEYLPGYVDVTIAPPPSGETATAVATVAPGFRNVKDAILAGSTRIGHATNAYLDDDLMLSLMGGDVLLEQQLVASLALKYISSYDEHPFPYYLRKRVPIAISTDDMGIYDSTITDDWFVAVKEFNLSWEEMKQIGMTAISNSFVKPNEKAALLNKLVAAQDAFAATMKSDGVAAFGSGALDTIRAFPCWWYNETLGATDECATARTRHSNSLPY